MESSYTGESSSESDDSVDSSPPSQSPEVDRQNPEVPSVIPPRSISPKSQRTVPWDSEPLVPDDRPTSPLDAEDDPVWDHLVACSERDNDDPLLKDLVALPRSQNPGDLVNGLLTRVVEAGRHSTARMRSGHTTKKQKPTLRPNKLGNKKGGVRNQSQQKRAPDYRVWQTLYAKDRRAAAAHVINGSSPSQSQEKPTTQAIEQAYWKIFGEPSPEDNHPTDRVDYGTDTSYRPITEAEIGAALKSTKPSAPGTDGIGIQDLRKVPPQLLETLFNAILATRKLSAGLKVCRTTLIPKGGASEDVANWRPITVTSVILRLFNKILAARR